MSSKNDDEDDDQNEDWNDEYNDDDYEDHGDNDNEDESCCSKASDDDDGDYDDDVDAVKSDMTAFLTIMLFAVPFAIERNYFNPLSFLKWWSDLLESLIN